MVGSRYAKCAKKIAKCADFGSASFLGNFSLTKSKICIPERTVFSSQNIDRGHIMTLCPSQEFQLQRTIIWRRKKSPKKTKKTKILFEVFSETKWIFEYRTLRLVNKIRIWLRISAWIKRYGHLTRTNFHFFCFFAHLAKWSFNFGKCMKFGE